MKIRKFKSASLELSVNAIIVFVLAFAMLGVGIFVTNKLRTSADGGLGKADEIIKSIEEEPTAEKPLVGLSDELTIPANKRELMAIKFYNKAQDTIEEVAVVIDNCKSTSTSEYYSGSGYPVDVVSDVVTIEPSTYQSIRFSVNNNRKLESGDTYICKLYIAEESVINNGDPTESGNNYYSKSLFVKISS